MIPGATPVYRQPYPVLQVHLETFKKKLRSFSRHWSTNPSERHRKGFANFFCAKKGWYRRWVWDIRELNNVVKRTQYTLPIITNVLRRRKGYEFLTKLEISMMFYTFALDDGAQKMCTIVTPFGLFDRYLANVPGNKLKKTKRNIRGNRLNSYKIESIKKVSNHASPN